MPRDPREIVLSAAATLEGVSHDALTEVASGLHLEAQAPIGEVAGLPVWDFAPEAAPPISALSGPDGALLRLGQGRLWLCGGARVLAAPQDLVARLLEEMGASPTGAEARLALRLLEGHDLASAAVLDGVGRETRRSQLKSLAAKLGLRRQTDLVRVLSERVVHALAALRAPSAVGRHWRAYAAAHLPDGVRLTVLEDARGVPRPVLDYGPRDATPVMVLHPMFLPRFEPRDVAHAAEQGLRLIWPIRPGLIDPDAPWQDAEAHVRASVAGAEAAWQAFAGRPCPVVALVSSASTAVRWARQAPGRVSQIAFAATCYSAGRHLRNPRYFGTDLAELALRSPAVLGSTVAVLRRLSTPERFRASIYQIFRGSAPDQAELDREFQRDGGARLRHAVLSSPESVRHDFFNQVHFRWDEARGLPQRLRFVHGAEDFIHPPGGIRALADRFAGAQVTVLDGLGHLPHGAALRRFLTAALDPA